MSAPREAKEAAPPEENSPDEAIPAHSGRRRHTRKELRLDVSLFSDSNFYTGFTEDISEGGVFIATHSLLPVGETVDLNITFPTDEVLRAKGVVRWIREFNESSDTKPGVGIQFDELDDRGAIEAFLKARSPLFHEE